MELEFKGVIVATCYYFADMNVNLFIYSLQI